MADLQHLGQRQVGLFKVAVIIYGGGWGGGFSFGYQFAHDLPL